MTGFFNLKESLVNVGKNNGVYSTQRRNVYNREWIKIEFTWYIRVTITKEQKTRIEEAMKKMEFCEYWKECKVGGNISHQIFKN